MSNWRIEPARTGRGQCKQCRERIDQGVLRFGQDDGPTASWFHLHCAKLGAPRAFKPFEARAAQLQRGAAKARRKAPAPSDSSLEVLADWLQENGDPWGTLIALRLAGKQREANEFLVAHEVALCGSFSASDFDWRTGVIVGAELSGANLTGPLRALLALPTAARLERLSLSGNVSPVLPALSRDAPATLAWLRLDAMRARGVGELKLPRLRELTLVLPGGALESVLDATLPGLRVLRLANHGDRPPTRFFERLLASDLLAQLEELDFASRTVLHGEALRALLEHVGKLEHLKRLSVPFEDWTVGKAQRELAHRHFRARNWTASEAARREEERYQAGLD